MRKRDREKIVKLNEHWQIVNQQLQGAQWYIEGGAEIKGANLIASAYRRTLLFMDEVEAVFKRMGSDISYERKDHYANHDQASRRRVGRSVAKPQGVGPVPRQRHARRALAKRKSR